MAAQPSAMRVSNISKPRLDSFVCTSDRRSSIIPEDINSPLGASRGGSWGASRIIMSATILAKIKLYCPVIPAAKLFCINVHA